MPAATSTDGVALNQYIQPNEDVAEQTSVMV